MSSSEKPRQRWVKDSDFPYLIGVATVFAIAFVAVLVYWNHFGAGDLSPKTESWGQFGDFVGGVINPAVGLLTICLIFHSIKIQRRELNNSLEELRRANEAAALMSFEQSLFAWLANYHEQIQQIEFRSFKGRSALQEMYKSKLSPQTTIEKIGYYPPVIDDSRANSQYSHLQDEGKITQLGWCKGYAIKNYKETYSEHKSHIGAPFRTIYRLIRWIDKSSISNAQKWHYCALIRSQLSWAETVFLYYNGFIPEGRKLAKYANQYALFDNIENSDGLINWSTHIFTSASDIEKPSINDYKDDWPYSISAFNSSVAKSQIGIPTDA